MKFTLRKHHLELLKNANIGWSNCEYGAPGIDPKRPYGNSDADYDIAGILGMELFEDAYGERHISKEQMEHIDKTHKETQTALAIILMTQSFKLGEYETSDEYSSDWKLIKEL